MTSVRTTISIRADRATVFAAYTREIDRWWPRQGTYRYSFAPPDTGPGQIHFEPWLDGRFYERFADGREYVIGQITHWEPPERLAYTWRDPRWPAPTTVEVTFFERAAETLVTVVHSGFGRDGVPEAGAGYGVGQQEILAALADWIRAGQRTEGRQNA